MKGVQHYPESIWHISPYTLYCITGDIMKKSGKSFKILGYLRFFFPQVCINPALKEFYLQKKLFFNLFSILNIFRSLQNMLAFYRWVSFCFILFGVLMLAFVFTILHIILKTTECYFN